MKYALISRQFLLNYHFRHTHDDKKISRFEIVIEKNLYRNLKRSTLDFEKKKSNSIAIERPFKAPIIGEFATIFFHL